MKGDNMRVCPSCGGNGKGVGQNVRGSDGWKHTVHAACGRCGGSGMIADTKGGSGGSGKSPPKPAGPQKTSAKYGNSAIGWIGAGIVLLFVVNALTGQSEEETETYSPAFEAVPNQESVGINAPTKQSEESVEKTSPAFDASVDEESVVANSAFPDWGGEWAGNVEQDGYGRYDVEMDLAVSEGGKWKGAGRYPGLGCASSLIEILREDYVLRLRERIDSGPCFSGEIVLARTQSGETQWKWFTETGQYLAGGYVRKLSGPPIAPVAADSPTVITSGDRAPTPMTVAQINDLDGDGYALLHHFAMQGKAASVASLLEQGADVNVLTGKSALTALHLAAFDGDLPTLALLLKFGAQIDAKDNMGRTPLHWAAKGENPAVIPYLVANGAEVSARDSEKLSPIEHSVLEGKVEIVKALRKNGAIFDPNEFTMDPFNTFHGEIIVYDRPEVVAGMIAAGADLNLPDRRNGNAALHLAAWHERLDLIGLLLQAGAEINLQNDLGYTPLFLAVGSENGAVVELLLNTGADRTITSNTGTTPLALAREKESADIILLLSDN